MTRSRVRPANLPLPLQLALGLYKTCASLRLAVVLITIFVVVLAWATILESAHFFGYQSGAVQYGIYGTWWFAALNVLLGLNVFCAALTRFPWKKRHTGFLVTHAGILVLLLGCLLTYRGGIDANLPVFEGEAAWRAYQNAQSLKLTISPNDDDEPSPGADPVSQTETITIPFVAGPFNWEDYDRMFPFPWCLARRDRGVVFDQDGIQLEVLDYYSDSKEIPVPRITLRVVSGSAHSRTLADDPGEVIELEIDSSRSPHGTGRPFGVGARRTLAGGQRIVFTMTGSRAETDAFRDSRPQGPLGSQGQIVLHARGKRFQLSVEQLQQKGREPLGDTGLEVELAQFFPRLLGVRLLIHHQDDPPQRMFLLADLIEMNQQDDRNGVFGSFWMEPATPAEGEEVSPQAAKMLHNARLPRIDVLQGADRKLYYRTWNCPKVGAITPLPNDGTEVVVLEDTGQPLKMYVEEFLPSDKPGMKLQPAAFNKDKNPALKQRQARMRLTVDGTSETFWLAGLASGESDAARLPPEYRRVVAGKGRRVAVTMARDEIDIGFQVYLRKFERKLDPGSHMVSHYRSLVDFCDREDQQRRLQENVLITLNAPVTFPDLRSGRSYRLYQSSFAGPFRPGDPQFRQVVGGARMRGRLFQSIFSVNYDPGRGVKYVGSLMICIGILIMFYMKAYFFGKRNDKRAE